MSLRKQHYMDQKIYWLEKAFDGPCPKERKRAVRICITLDDILMTIQQRETIAHNLKWLREEI